MVWLLLPKILGFWIFLNQSRPNHICIFVNHLFSLFCRNIELTIFCQFEHQHTLTKIKLWCQIIGDNIGSFAKPLCPFLCDIQMLVGTKRFVLYWPWLRNCAHMIKKIAQRAIFHTPILQPPPQQSAILNHIRAVLFENLLHFS